VKVLFVCLGNSCRSQMAEGWARELGIEAASAGTNPADNVAPNAVTVMSEKAIDISQHTPSHVDDFDADDWDQIIKMGCEVYCQNLPIAADWGLSDPHGGPVEEYRATRDEIEQRMRELIASN